MVPKWCGMDFATIHRKLQVPGLPHVAGGEKIPEAEAPQEEPVVALVSPDHALSGTCMHIRARTGSYIYI